MNLGILVECPKCKVRGSVKRKVCKCGNQVQKSDSKNYWIDYYTGVFNENAPIHLEQPLNP